MISLLFALILPCFGDDAEQLVARILPAAPNSAVVLAGPHIYRLSRSLAVRSDVTLVLESGAVLAPDKNVTVTIDGPLQVTMMQLFAGEGSIRLGDSTVAQVYPQWWGAFNDGTHEAETTRALQAAFDSGHEVVIPRGTYLSQELILRKEGAVVRGANRESSILKFNPSRGSFLTLTASFVKVRDLKVQGLARDSTSATTGILFQGSTRSQLDNVRIGGFGYGVRVTKIGGNNINHCYIYQNRRAGIYLSEGAHGLSITGGTEIADAPFGVVLGKFRESPWDLDYDFAGVAGQMVSIEGAIIEGIHPVAKGTCKDCLGGVGIYSAMAQKGIRVSGTYFEEMNVALQLGSKLKNDGKSKHHQAVMNISFRDNFLSSVHSAVKVGRADFGEISNNHCSGVKHFFDTSEAGLFQNVIVHSNFGYDRLLSNPYAADFGKDAP